MSQKKARHATDPAEQRKVLLQTIARTGANVFYREVAGHGFAIVIPGDTEFRGTVEQCHEFWERLASELENFAATARKAHDVPDITIERARELSSGAAQPTPEELSMMIDNARQLAQAGADMPHALEAIRNLRLMKSSDPASIERHELFEERMRATHEVHHAYTLQQFKAAVAAHVFHLVSFDFDLVDPEACPGSGPLTFKPPPYCGLDCVNELLAQSKDRWPAQVVVHSWNEGGAMVMIRRLRQVGLSPVRARFESRSAALASEAEARFAARTRGGR